MFSPTCFEQTSVHLQEDLYMQFNCVLSCSMHFFGSYYIFIHLCQRNSKNKHVPSIENVVSSYHMFLPALFCGTAQ